MKLTFDEDKHEYKLGGKVVPSVTQLLGPVQDWSHINPDVLAKKAAIGTAAHRAAELHDKGTLDHSSVHPVVQPYFDGYLKFHAEKMPAIILNESRLHHPRHRYAGTLDRLMLIDDQQWLIDLKTSVTHAPWVGIQLAGYLLMLEEDGYNVNDINRGALRLTKDGKYDLKLYDDPNDRAVFLSLLTIHNYKTRTNK